MSPEPKELRDAFGRFLTGVTIVTTRAADGTMAGFTANSFASVSLDPPLLLVCPARRLSSFALFETCARFAVSVLAEGQEDASNIFAGFKGDRFERVSWRPDEFGVPLIEGAAAYFSCQREQIIDAGDHIILLGRVDAFATSARRGLGFADGNYFSLGLERKAAAASGRAQKNIAGAIVQYGDKVLVRPGPEGIVPIEFEVTARGQVREALSDKLAEAGLNVSLGKAYSIYEDTKTGAQHIYFQAHANDDTIGNTMLAVPVSDLERLQYATGALRIMFARFALEFTTRDFGLYVGDEERGEVHKASEEERST